MINTRAKKLPTEDYIEYLEMDSEILQAGLKVMSTALDTLITECYTSDGKPKEPSRQALMRARGLLPPYCEMALGKGK